MDVLNGSNGSAPDVERSIIVTSDRAQFEAVRDMLGQGSDVSAAAKAASLSRQAVYRIQADPAGAEATLGMWGRSEKSP